MIELCMPNFLHSHPLVSVWPPDVCIWTKKSFGNFWVKNWIFVKFYWISWHQLQKKRKKVYVICRFRYNCAIIKCPINLQSTIKFTITFMRCFENYYFFNEMHLHANDRHQEIPYKINRFFFCRTQKLWCQT